MMSALFTVCDFPTDGYKCFWVLQKCSYTYILKPKKADSF